jgi:aspartate racemase
MKTAGIIGGIGPESTIEYYRLTIARYRDRTRDGSYPEILINSIDVTRMLDLTGANRLPELTDYLLDGIEKLARAGADFGALAANTPHVVFEPLLRRSPIPLISIVDATCLAARARGLKRAALVGTRFTMQGPFYREGMARVGIALVVPSSEEQDYIHEKYMQELVKGDFRPETRERLLAVIERLRIDDGVDGVILGGTELPLILRDEKAAGLPLLDTTRIHVEAIVAEMLS